MLRRKESAVRKNSEKGVAVFGGCDGSHFWGYIVDVSEFLGGLPLPKTFFWADRSVELLVSESIIFVKDHFGARGRPYLIILLRMITR